MVSYDHLPVPERIQRLRAEMFAAKDSVCWERAQILTRSYRHSEGEHPTIRRAKALYAIMDQMPLFIRPGELIVGQRASRLIARSVYPEYHLQGLEGETIPNELAAYWDGRTLDELAHGRYSANLTAAEAEEACGRATGRDSGYGHVIVDYEKALHLGFGGIIDEAEQELASATDAGERAWLEAAILSCQAIIRWAERYADLAETQAQSEPDAARRDELLRIAANCRRVPAQPPRNWWEALQAFWFVHLAMHIEQYGWSISAGRFDQYMLPHYRASLDAGMSDDQAWELLLSLWCKFMENVGTHFKVTAFQNLTLGGQLADGSDACNELSHLCLDASVALKLNQPALSVRWHKGIDPGFWAHVQRTIAQGLGMPALFNDDEMVGALVAQGVPTEEAIGYGVVGCVEACIPGRMQGVTSGGHLNTAKALELALNQGRSMLTDVQIGPETLAVAAMTTFDDVWEAYRRQVLHLCDLNIEATHHNDAVQQETAHCPLMSCLLDDCLNQHRDLVSGGVRHRLPGVCIYGPTNAVDGMMAIKTHVFDQPRVTLPALRQALLDDFEDHEPLRRMLANQTPRFGNDEPQTDAMANAMNALHADYLARQAAPREGRYTCGVWPVEGHLRAGLFTAATPDGRHARTPLVDGVGAAQGADRKGPTALLRSVARLDNTNHWAAGNTCNIKYAPASLELPDGLDRLGQLNTTFMNLGGMELQINVVDRETLLDAQRHPDEHENLIVRVAGFSAYFTQLSIATQNEIISRTEHVA